MIEAAEAAIEFAKGRDRAALDEDRMLTFALVRAIEIVGEAAGKVSQPTRNQLPQLPWAEAVAMRNRLIHGYFDIDADIVWVTVTAELPGLVAMLKKVLAET